MLTLSMVIYKVTNKITGMIYIGQTTGTAARRWNDHVSTAKHRATGRFYRAINKYGRDAFEVEVIATATTLDELNILEEQLIFEHDCLVPKGYNILPGGNNRRHHAETKAKLREALKGRPIPNHWDKGFVGNHTAETKAKIASKLKGRPIKNRQNGAKPGRPCTWGSKISKTMTGVAQPWKYKAVVCNETGVVYESVQTASKETGIERTALMYLLKSGGKTRNTRLSFSYVDPKVLASSSR